MRRSRLLLVALLNLLALVIVVWKFATMGSMADIFGIPALGLFVAAYVLLQRERCRIPADETASE